MCSEERTNDRGQAPQNSELAEVGYKTKQRLDPPILNSAVPDPTPAVPDPTLVTNSEQSQS